MSDLGERLELLTVVRLVASHDRELCGDYYPDACLDACITAARNTLVRNGISFTPGHVPPTPRAILSHPPGGYTT